MSAAGAGRQDRRAVVRLARAVERLDERRAQLTELRELAAAVDALRLVPVAGERWLATRLEQLADEAAHTARSIAGGLSSEAVSVRLRHLEEVLGRDDWAVAAAVTARLRLLRTETEAAVRRLREDRTTYQLWFSGMEDAVAAAVAAGAPVDPEDQAIADGLRPIEEAATDAEAGRLDAVAIAVGKARRLLDEQGLLPAGNPASAATRLQERIDRITRAAARSRRDDERRGRKTELFLLSVPGTAAATGTPVEYRVLLRRPSFESEQESNLHTEIQLRPEDQAGFRGMADEIAAAAVRGVRAIVEGTAVEPDAATRHIVLPAPEAGETDVEEPSERLARVGKLMYSLLISDAMQRLVAESDCALTVTSNDLELPWELMHDGDDFLCVKRAFARMPIGAVFPRRTRPPRVLDRTPWRVLLIHSDPHHADPTRRLAAAEREIDAIAGRLRGLVPEECIRILRPAAADVDTVTRHLSSGDYDVIHYAGHAGFDPTDSTLSHLLLHEGREFSADRIQKVLEGRPVVFLNACDTSRTRNAADESSGGGIVARAQGLASAFVYGGAHACVGSLWPVFDDTARDFAVSFYDRLFQRHRVGQALAEARQQSRAKNVDRLTWASYALYGDPLHRLREARSAAPTAGRTVPAGPS